jgi:hypothetical protein
VEVLDFEVRFDSYEEPALMGAKTNGLETAWWKAATTGPRVRAVLISVTLLGGSVTRLGSFISGDAVTPCADWSGCMAAAGFAGTDGASQPYCLTDGSPASQVASAVAVSYLGRSSVGLHEPIVVEFRVDNQSAQGIRLDLGFNSTRSFIVSVTTPDGRIVRTPTIPELNRGDQPVGRGSRSVPPFQRYSQFLLLNEWFPFNQPGAYRVDVDLTTEIRSDAGVPIETGKKGLIEFIVGPRDEQELQRICQALVERILGTTNVGQRRDAGRQLSYVVDPVAVVSIKQVFDGVDTVDDLLIQGLLRIGTGEAKRVLEGLAASNTESRRLWAVDALRRFTGRQ